MAKTRYYSDSKTTANPLASVYNLAVTANTEFITNLKGAVYSSQIRPRRPPSVIRFTMTVDTAGDLTVTLTDGTTATTYKVNGNVQVVANQPSTYVLEVPAIEQTDLNTVIFLAISSLKYSANATIKSLEITEINGP